MAQAPVILSLESSTSVCSVAISQGDTLLSLRETIEGNKHSKWMTIFIEEALEEAKKSFEDIQLIAVSAGPGSYTGLRVAYSIAKGIAYSRNLPMVEINTLDSLSRAFRAENNQTSNSIIIPMIDARRMEVYRKIYDSHGTALKPMEAYILEDNSFDEFQHFEKIILLGDGASKVQDLNLPSQIQSKLHFTFPSCSAKYLRYEAYTKWQKKEFSDVAYCNPTYLKSPNITKSKKNILQS